MLNRIKNQKGFTLIELLIVIVIIGVLAVIVIGLTGTNARRKANDARAKADMHELQNALEQYFVDMDAYPAVSGWQAALVPDYLGAVLDAPTGAGGYVLTALADTEDYIMTYDLENANDSGPKVDGSGNYVLTSKQ